MSGTAIGGRLTFISGSGGLAGLHGGGTFQGNTNTYRYAYSDCHANSNSNTHS